jgi:hypothetical protein
MRQSLVSFAQMCQDGFLEMQELSAAGVEQTRNRASLHPVAPAPHLHLHVHRQIRPHGPVQANVQVPAPSRFLAFQLHALRLAFARSCESNEFFLAWRRIRGST